MPNPVVTSQQTCAELLLKCTQDKIKKDERVAFVNELIEGLVKTPEAVGSIKLFAELEASLITSGKKDAAKRHGACLVLAGLVEKFGIKYQADFINLFSKTIDLLGDKSKPTREAALEATDALYASFNPNAIQLILFQLTTKCNNPVSNEKRLLYIADFATKHKPQMQCALTTIIPEVALDMHDIKAEVSAAARAALLALTAACDNTDVKPVIPALVDALENVENVSQCVYQLASTTFVEIVDQATLSLICPILVTGFRGRDNKVKRGCARIVDNMTTLVEDSRAVKAFMETLLPLMQAAAKNIPNPEYREVCVKACKTLTEKAVVPPLFNMVTPEEVGPVLMETVGKKYNTDANKATLELISSMICILNNIGGDSLADDFTAAVSPIVASFAGSESTKLVSAILEKTLRKDAGEVNIIAEENAEKLCDCEFSLAYGNKVLLKKTNLVLYRGLRYGLIGKNDSGKTSLMRAIAEYRVDGFPKADELRTIFVETDIKAEFADVNIVEYMLDEPLLAQMGIKREQIEAKLTEFGFVEGQPATLKNTCGTLSGGWRMKLALARAMLLNADILLLDEPTNHLDTFNVKWVEDYLMSLDRVTSIMVSHDSGLLDRVTTNMIQIDRFKINFFKGNLSAFVAQNPTAKSYFELKADNLVFHFPRPGPLAGVNSKGKAIMKMNDISFTYPGVKKAQLNHVTCSVSLGSRVACVGVNGAGKSTMIKLLTGELEPDEGSGKIWSHPNLRVGYIAQHAFFHIDKHMDMNANEYVRWRYANGNDREEQAKVTNLVTPEEQKQMDAAINVVSIDKDTGLAVKSKIKVGRLTEGRRSNKSRGEQEYECTIKDSTNNVCVWILRSELIKNGWEKVINQTDSRIATRAAMYAQPLTTGNVIKHYEHVGLEEEFSTHVRMSSLSGGQKVKVVLGAAMWNKPHVLILDEPTNYLDRESLGALATAIREFEGGVVMITHNSQFCDNLCPIVWHLQNNTLELKGDSEWMKEMGMQEVKVEEKKDKDDLVDAHGNTITLKKNLDELTPKEVKQRKKKLEKWNKGQKKKGLETLRYDEMFEEDWDLVLA
jgi:elongation factor 3